MQDKTTILPLELWRVILSHLSIVDLCHCCQVSKIWAELVRSLDNTRWKELYLFRNPWRHPNWPIKPKDDPQSWQKAYKERFLASRQWVKSGAEVKCGIGVWHLLKKRHQKRLYVGYNRTYSRLKDAVAASSSYDTIYVDDEGREEQSPLIIKHPLEIIGKGTEGKIRLNAIEIQSTTVRISNVCLRPSSHRPQNPLPTVLKVSSGKLYLDNSTIEHGHVQVTSPGSVHITYCAFNNASIQLRTSSMCKIEHCEFQNGEHSAILIEGTQSLGKYMPLGILFADWIATHSHKNLTVKELYNHIVQKNLQKTFKDPDEEMTDCHLLIKDLKEKLNLWNSDHQDIPSEMSVPLAQRSSLPLQMGALNALKNSTGCVVRECHFKSKRGAVHVRRQGSAWVEGCEISNVAYGIRCMGSSKVILLANTIHDCNTSGVFFRDRAGGLVAGNVIYQNREAGVDIRNSSDPYLQHNQIFNGCRSGVVVLDSGRGMIIDNDIYDNNEAGVYILYRGNPIVRCNRIWAGQAAGIAVTEDGFGHVYFNDICGMEWGGIDIRNGGHPIIMNNTIHKGHGDGVVIGKRGCGLIFENVIRKNRGCGVWVLSTSRPVIFGNHISDCCDHGVAFVSTADDLRENQKLSAQFLQQDNEQEQAPPVHIYDEEPSSGSFFEDADSPSIEFLTPKLKKNSAIVDSNKISFNQGCGLSFAGSEDIIIRANTFNGNHGNGIAIEQPVEATIHSNRVLDNGGSGIILDVSSFTHICDNCVRGNLGNGIVAQGRGHIRENDVIGNGKSGVVILGPGDPFVSKNRILSGESSAVNVRADARGCVNENELHSKAGKNIVQDLNSTTIVENNELLSNLEGEIAGVGVASRPIQSWNTIPRDDISHIVSKLSMPHARKTNSKTMSKFCVIL